jgi:hypothetical protein
MIENNCKLENRCEPNYKKLLTENLKLLDHLNGRFKSLQEEVNKTKLK